MVMINGSFWVYELWTLCRCFEKTYMLLLSNLICFLGSHDLDLADLRYVCVFCSYKRRKKTTFLCYGDRSISSNLRFEWYIFSILYSTLLYYDGSSNVLQLDGDHEWSTCMISMIDNSLTTIIIFLNYIIIENYIA